MKERLKVRVDQAKAWVKANPEPVFIGVVVALFLLVVLVQW